MFDSGFDELQKRKFPAPSGIRFIADHLASFYRTEDYPPLIRAQQYNEAQQLTGALDVISDLYDLADSLASDLAEDGSASDRDDGTFRVFVR
jgi:hypothetical protein